MKNRIISITKLFLITIVCFLLSCDNDNDKSQNKENTSKSNTGKPNISNENNNEASSIEKSERDIKVLEQKLENYKILDDKQKTEIYNQLLALNEKIWDNQFNLFLEVLDYCKTLIKEKKTAKQMKVLINQKFKNRFEKDYKIKTKWENVRKNLDEQIKSKMNKEGEVQSEKYDKIVKQIKNKLILLIDKQNYEDEEKVKMKEFVNYLG